jgi:hypothetical protein
MPTLRLIYLPEHQYQHAFVTPAEDETNNTTAELPTTTLTRRIHEQSRFPVDDATRNASSNEKKKPPAVGGEEKMEKQEQSDDDHEDDDDDYVADTLLQEEEAIDEVNKRTCSFGSQVPHEEMISSDKKSENDSDSSSLEFVDAVQQFQHETMVSSDKGIENCDSTSSPVDVDAIQQKSGKKRKRRTPNKTFDDRFNDLMAFKAKYGHCNASQRGDDASLGLWCTNLRVSYKKKQHNQKPQMKLSDEQIQRLNDAGFKWSLKVGSGFDDRFNDLMAFKAKNGHCNVSQLGEDVSLGRWCTVLRGSYKKKQNNQKQNTKLSDEQIQRLSDAGFKWSLPKVGAVFDEHFNDFMAFKAKYGHCNVSQFGEDASLGRWCHGRYMRGSYKKMQNNQKPQMKLSDEQIQRLGGAGFKWCLEDKKKVEKRWHTP